VAWRQRLDGSGLAARPWGGNIPAVSPAGAGKAQFRPTVGTHRAGLVDRVRCHRPAPRWLAPLLGLGLVIVSSCFSSTVGYALIVAGCALLGTGLGACAGDPTGLRQHRQ
jgi:hypothetical protein